MSRDREAAVPASRVYFRLKMASRREAIAPTVEQIMGRLAAAGLDAEQHSNLALALSEALSNGVVHGNRLRLQLPVLVAVCIEPGQGVTIDVRDFGPGFRAARLTDPCDAEHVLAPSGRGVFLMRHLVDRVSFNARGNRVRLVELADDGG
jgi:serine/threonine-protein kinase RsbW